MTDVYYLGPEGTFTHQAAIAAAGKIGGESLGKVLLGQLGSSDAALSSAALTALKSFKGDLSGDLVSALQAAQNPNALLQLASSRKIATVAPALLSRLQAEGRNGDCDIFYDLEVVNAEILLNSDPELFADLSEYDFSIYDPSVTAYTERHRRYAVNGKTAGAFLVNTALMEERGLPVPASYEDMLNPAYAELISMPSPLSSGTGYSYYNGMITLLGPEEGLKYFDDLYPNILEFTTSGSAPAKSAVRGDAAIAYGLLWQCVQYAGENSGLTVVLPPEGLAYDLFVMGMISGHETKPAVKEVFTCLYEELNRPQCARFNPDRIYAEMPPAEIPGYPESYAEIAMNGLFDFRYKQDLLDQWIY